MRLKLTLRHGDGSQSTDTGLPSSFASVPMIRLGKTSSHQRTRTIMNRQWKELKMLSEALGEAREVMHF